MDRLRKIEALAKGGSPGERENAQRLLEALCAKHGVSLEDVIAPEKSMHEFAFSGKHERKLLTQVLFHVLQVSSISYGKKSKSFVLELTTMQAMDVRECWEHYRALWRSQLADFASAFIHTNRIYGPPTPYDEDAPSPDMAELLRIVALMKGMESERWERTLRLTAGK